MSLIALLFASVGALRHFLGCAFLLASHDAKAIKLRTFSRGDLSMRTMVLCGVLSCLAGCASKQPQYADTVELAKIRIFNYAATTIHPGKTCYGDSDGGAIRATGSLSMVEGKKKVGMPVTDDLPWSYTEYKIPAGQPTTLEMYYNAETGGMKQTCGPVGVTFTPLANKYYDTSMIFSGSGCSIRVRELTEVGPGKASASPIKTESTYRCFKK